ncbi:alkaline D-peptidase. Serine peptidase. MEROPS family S12 [Micromonospora pattaloongensis]|uniref:Alkaline D-peptidase. Serine peptidase. MEROPS family S12 n=1 Tax=Micromonospora pattaloongensis TaxID=405436 RepID=A0A1H3GPU6_9ACTN|nr:serine hydrolase domain-containing protein [Micromonospora pattaloongensis]SDY05070.1 alkaline D-peptidase. Serine peptidase. MEROPS family S12 [Micromonospora pattaloongensis]
MTTRRLLLRTGVTATVALTAGAVTGTSAAAAPAAHPRRDALQQALDDVVALGASGALAELRDGDGVWRGGSGVAELGHSRPVPTDGRFRVGSVTKTFVATVVLQLVGEGRLGLDDPVERWLPKTLPAGDRITVRHLLQHRSGLYNYTDEVLSRIEDFIRDRYRTYRPRDLVALAADKPLLFEPGTSWSYCNTNYILLGLVIERVTRRAYGDEIARRILRPLRAWRTELPGTDPFIAGPHAHGYLPVERDGGIQPVDITAMNPSVAGAAGEMISTAADLNRFYRALLTGRLLRPAQLRAMTTQLAGPLEYGLGIFRVPLPSGTMLWGHTGGIPGYVTYALTTEDGGAQLAISLNPWGGDPSPALEQLVLTAFSGTAPTTRSATAAVRIPLLDRGW